MANISNLFKMLDKLDDIIYKPVEAISDWIVEPLKTRKHQREIETLEKESQIKREEQSHEVNLKIREKTEVVKILAELEEWKKNEELKRMEAISEAIIKYHKILTKINTDALKAIGAMPIELRDKAHSLVLEKSQEYKKIQDAAWNDTVERLHKINTDFKDNEQGKEILLKMVDKMTANIIDNAGDFMKQLKTDLIEINKSINELTKAGEKALEKHFDQYREIDKSSYKRLTNDIEEIEIIKKQE